MSNFAPKKEPNTFCLIHNLYFPFGASLNDSIDKDLVSVSYSTFDQAIELVCQFGSSALMVKDDIESAFQLPEVYPDGFNLFGFQFIRYLLTNAFLWAVLYFVSLLSCFLVS